MEVLIISVYFINCLMLPWRWHQIIFKGLFSATLLSSKIPTSRSRYDFSHIYLWWSRFGACHLHRETGSEKLEKIAHGPRRVRPMADGRAGHLLIWFLDLEIDDYLIMTCKNHPWLTDRKGNYNLLLQAWGY